MAEISFASLDDASDIMRFMDEVWRKDHILSTSRELFFHEFQEGNKLNMAIARNGKRDLVGLFGFIKYNNNRIPDLAGSLWKVAESEKEPMLGFKLREFVMQNVRHRFFAAPGAGLQTKPIYQFLKMDWNRMRQYYLINDTLDEFSLVVYPVGHSSAVKDIIIDDAFELKLVTDLESLREFSFEAFDHILPYKDWAYFKKRFCDYPIYRYDLIAFRRGLQILNLIVCRIDTHDGATACRLVDFYGEEFYLPQIAARLYRHILERGYEYLDFICHGFDEGIMRAAGFLEVDFESDKVVIPNYFGPFDRRNVPVYCVSDRSDLRFRQVKADGDQDRPANLP